MNYFERHLSASLGRFVSSDPVTLTADRLIDPQLLNPDAAKQRSALLSVL